MKTLILADSGRIGGGEAVFIRPVKPASLLRRFRRYIETSDWDERIIRKESCLDKICLTVVALSGIVLIPYLAAAVLR